MAFAYPLRFANFLVLGRSGELCVLQGTFHCPRTEKHSRRFGRMTSLTLTHVGYDAADVTYTAMTFIRAEV